MSDVALDPYTSLDDGSQKNYVINDETVDILIK